MGKKIKARRRGKGKWKRNLGILLYVTAFAIIIILSAIYQRSIQPPPVPKKPANTYFSFSEGFALAEALDPENTSIRISQVGFNITAVGGNATNVHVFPLQGMVSETDSFIIPKLSQGESREVAPITYQTPIVVQKEGNVWPLRFRISCTEAYGNVTINVTEYFSLPT